MHFIGIKIYNYQTLSLKSIRLIFNVQGKYLGIFKNISWCQLLHGGFSKLNRILNT